MNADGEKNEVNKVVEYTDNANSYNSYNDGGNAGNKNNNKINLPNKLTIFRIILVPVFMIFILVPLLGEVWSKILAASLFLIAALTDLIDGLLARKLNLVTNFGKFLDPVADKFMIVGALIAITASESFAEIRFLTVWAAAIVFFREFAVTSVRLVANSSDGNVIAANFTAKLKTLFQCVCVITILLEEKIITNNLHTPKYLFSYITTAIMLVLTLYSGFVYFKTYWNYIDPRK